MIRAQRRGPALLIDHKVRSVQLLKTATKNHKADDPIVKRFLKASSDIGPAIKLVRVLFGISQKDLADRLAVLLGEPVTQSYVCHIERKACGLSLDRFLAICDALDIEPSAIIAIALKRRRIHALAKRDISQVYESIKKKIESRLDKLAESP